ncbi:MAG: DNA repair protein RecN [Deltaproteobacteria bacterium]|nr:DNA repair protein RecN [Deltaproteobacteria bacterium]
MLRHLHVKNLALIDELELSFNEGLNVITGETGAGKSLLMQAFGLAVGGRATADLIRHDTQEATVEAIFALTDARITRLLEESGYASDDELLVRRVISQNGRGRVYLNGAAATVTVLRHIGERLMHIYGQHEQQVLLEAEAAIGLVDGFAALGKHTGEMAHHYQTLRHLWSRFQALTAGKAAAAARRELVRFQVEEIKNSALRTGEEEALRQEKLVLLNAEKLARGVAAGEELLAAGEEAVTDRLGRLLTRLRELARIDEHLNEAVGLLNGGLAQVEEAALHLRRYGERLQMNPERLEEIETRLSLLSRLKQKYGGSVEAVLALQAALEQELQQIEGGEETIVVLRQEVETAATAAWATARELSQARRAAATILETQMAQELDSLGMKGAAFSVRFSNSPEREETADEDGEGTAGPFLRGAQRLRPIGCDRVEFYLSANLGEPLLPLVQVASGGELSRLMLALKALSAAVGEAPVLIFDEVDAGIGGGVAEVVGRRLKALARQRQVLCITHLPQIAAFADHAYTVVKRIAHGRTVSSARQLSPNEQLQELARMLGGVAISAEARRHAREMLEAARRRE